MIYGLRGEEPKIAANSKAAAKPEEFENPETLPEILAELRRITTQLDALSKQIQERMAGTERSHAAPGDTAKAIRELRSSVDAASEGTKQARGDLSGRLAKIEAAVGELPAAAQAAGEVVEHLKLARSNLAGLSERIGGLERRLSEKFKPIDSAAVSVRETSDGLAATARTLDAAAQANAQMLPRVTKIEQDVSALTSLYLVLIVCLCLAAVLMVLMAADKRFGLFEWIAGFL